LAQASLPRTERGAHTLSSWLPQLPSLPVPLPHLQRPPRLASCSGVAGGGKCGGGGSGAGRGRAMPREPLIYFSRGPRGPFNNAKKKNRPPPPPPPPPPISHNSRSLSHHSPYAPSSYFPGTVGVVAGVAAGVAGASLVEGGHMRQQRGLRARARARPPPPPPFPPHLSSPLFSPPPPSHSQGRRLEQRVEQRVEHHPRRVGRRRRRLGGGGGERVVGVGRQLGRGCGRRLGLKEGGGAACFRVSLSLALPLFLALWTTCHLSLPECVCACLALL